MKYTLLVLTIFLSIPTQAETMIGRVVRIVDGDTVVFLDQTNAKHKIRLAGIDTPERSQPFGRRATEHLAQLTGNKAACIEWEKVDRYKRIIGKIWVHSPDTSCHSFFGTILTYGIHHFFSNSAFMREFCNTVLHSLSFSI